MQDAPDYIDRMSGRQGDDDTPEEDLSLDERLLRFEEARAEFERAERSAASAGRDEALSILQNSMRFHAGRISEPELSEALENGRLQAETVRTVLKYKADDNLLQERVKSASAEQRTNEVTGRDRGRTR